MKKYLSIITLLIAFFFSSCFKEIEKRENEKYQINDYITKLKIPFEQLPSGVFLHKYFDGVGQFFKKNDSIKIVYSAYNLDKKVYIKENDSFTFIVGNKQILEGWNEIAQNFAIGGNGIAIFPYYTAFGNSNTPFVDANSTIVFTFSIQTNNYIVQQKALLYKFAHDNFYNKIVKINDTMNYANLYSSESNINAQFPVVLDYFLFSVDKKSLVSKFQFSIDQNTLNIPKGVIDIIPQLRQGQLVVAFIFPYSAFVTTNPYNLKPYSSLYAYLRIKSSDSIIEENSVIQRYLQMNNLTIDKTLSNGTMSIKVSTPTVNTIVDFGKTITYSSTIIVLNNNLLINECKECETEFNNNNFENWQVECLKTLKKGEKRNFIVPFKNAYNGHSHGNIPPYSTLLYKVEIIDII